MHPSKLLKLLPLLPTILIYACGTALFHATTPTSKGVDGQAGKTPSAGPSGTDVLPSTKTGPGGSNGVDANNAGGVAGPRPQVATANQSSNGIANIISTLAQSFPSARTSGPATTISTVNGPVPIPSTLQPCSQNYFVPATANPYLSGTAGSASLTYTLQSGDPQTPTDTMPAQEPVLVTPTNTSCVKAGAVLYFEVYGGVSYSRSEPLYDANGDLQMIRSHQLGSVLGKSSITAPMNSLLGVFLTDGDPTNQAAPAALDFSTAAARDYQSMSPAV
ncbi:MAG: hypothetical protein NTZ90_16990, partial [Proteobacteria bacterium]|nr:hypothetical protein [Pseudomonadota bacterium]